MADKFLRCEVVGSIANSITVKPYVDGAGIITVYQQDNILFDPETLRAEGVEGEWVLKDHLWECNKCGCRINVKNPLCNNNLNYYFCPHCGARMKGERQK